MPFEEPKMLSGSTDTEKEEGKTETSEMVSEKINQLHINVKELCIMGKEISERFRDIGTELSKRQKRISDKFEQMQKDYEDVEKLHSEEERTLKEVETEEKNCKKLSNRGAELLEKLENDFNDYKSKETTESK